MGLNVFDKAFQDMYGILTGSFNNGAGTIQEFSRNDPKPGNALPNEGIVDRYQENAGITAADRVWEETVRPAKPTAPGGP